MSTPDIFLSYNREDSERAKQFAEGFTAQGLDVWWDVALRSGEAYDKVTENALKGAKAVVVLWSKKSVDSRWVRAEATLADRKKTLMPVMIEDCERPIMFELIQTADLSHWDGKTSDKAWKDFVCHVCEFIGKEAQATPDKRSADEPLPSLDQVSLVVLPFLNMGGDPEQEYFADGITEDVITDLSKVSALKVIARNTAFTFKGRPVDVANVARQLNVTHVLEGSVRKAGNRVRVTAQLIDGSDSSHAWADRWDRNLDDIFELQDELSQEIVKALRLKLLPQEKKAIAERGTDNLEAYDLYLRAKALHSTYGFENIEHAVALYKQAIKLDPNFAQAWLRMVSAYLTLHVYAPAKVEGRIDEVVEAFERGYKLQPDLPEAIVAGSSLGLFNYDWDRSAAFIDLGVAPGTTIGFNATCLGRAREGVELQLETRKLDPLSSGTSFVLQNLLDAAGRLDEAEAEFERSKQLVGPNITTEWRALTRAMVRGDHKRVRDLYRNHFDGGEHFQPFRPKLLEVIDHPDRAIACLREAALDPGLQDAARQAAIANWAVYFGDTDLALETLRRGFVDHRPASVFLDLWLPNLAGIRRDPRFKQMIVDIGLADYWRRSGNWGDFARPVGDDDFEMIA